MEIIASSIEVVFYYILSMPGWLIVLLALILWVVYIACKGLYYLLSVRLTDRYQAARSYHRETDRKILLVGDSTAVGTGSADPDKTLASFLAMDFPKTSIINCAVNGSLTREVEQQMDLVRNQVFDLVVISTGGNDVWTVTKKATLKKDLIRVLQMAKKISNSRVVLLFFGNEGSAPFFPLFLKGFLLKRTEIVKEVFTEVAAEEKVPLIELFSQPSENPFVKDPGANFAPDGLHPNEHGYWNWYKHLWRLMVQDGHMYHE